jgi:hypothetical protein
VFCRWGGLGVFVQVVGLGVAFGFVVSVGVLLFAVVGFGGGCVVCLRVVLVVVVFGFVLRFCVVAILFFCWHGFVS